MGKDLPNPQDLKSALETGLTEFKGGLKPLLPLGLKVWAVLTAVLVVAVGIETYLLVGSARRSAAYEVERARLSAALKVAEAQASSNRTVIVYKERILYSNLIIYSNREADLEALISRYRFITNWWDAVRIYQDSNRASN